MIYKIKKKDLNVYIKNFRKLLSIGDGVIIAGDCMHPVSMEVSEDVLSVNGTTTARSFLPFSLPENLAMITVMNLSEVLKMLSELKGISKLELRVDDDTIRIGFDNKEIIIATRHKSMNGGKFTDDYQKYQALLNIVNKDDDGNNICSQLSINQLNDIRYSKPVTLETSVGKVRISRNLFSLSGPIKKTGPMPFSALWATHAVTLPDGSEDYVLGLTVSYNDLDAVHLYSVAPF